MPNRLACSAGAPDEAPGNQSARGEKGSRRKCAAGGGKEIEPLETRRRYAEAHAQRSGHDTGDRDADQRRHAVLGPKPGGGKGAEAEKCTVVQRYLAGEPNQHVEPQRRGGGGGGQ